MFIRLFVNPEATLCFIDKGEAVLLRFSDTGWSVDHSWG